MTTTTSGDLARVWAERVRHGVFSAVVAGTREVRVFGQASSPSCAPWRLARRRNW